MILVDGDVASVIMSLYMSWIVYMLREIELKTLVDAIYIVYIDSFRIQLQGPHLC